MAGKRVAVVSPDGQFGTVDEAEVEQLPDGARVLSQQQVAERAVEERYDALPTYRKALGVASTVAAMPLGPLGIGQATDAPPSVAAFGAGVRHGLTAGLADAGARKLADEIGGKEVGDKYAARVDEEREASPIAHTAGSVTGMAAGAAIGPGAGAARALPSAAMGTVGTAVEHGVARALGGLASRGVLGQAAATGTKMAARGAIEGGIYSGVEQVGSNVLHDTPDVGEKLYAAAGHGFLTGGALGGALGFSGSLAASGYRGLASRVSSRLADGGAPAAQPRSNEWIHPDQMPFQRPVSSGAEVPFIDADAGLKGAAPDVELPFSMGAERRPMQLRPDVGQRGRTAAEEPFSFGRRLSIDPDAGMKAPINAGDGPIELPLFNRGTRRAALDAAMHSEESPLGARLADDAFDFGRRTSASKKDPIKHGFDVDMDLDAGIAKRGAKGRFQGPVEATDALKLSSAKNVPRDIDVNVGDELARTEARSPIRIPEIAEAPKPKGIFAALVNSDNPARTLAEGQAWNAVGAGFGLQSTRYAKEAQKYFANSTRDLGEVALRHGLVDMGAAKSSPLEAAWAAAKSGTAADIAPKAEIALEKVGRQIGEITDASGARVKLSELESAIDGVRRPYDRVAGNEHVVNALDNYAASLRSKLGASPDGTVRIQDLLEQRKGLDRIVYQETKTLDPGRRVEALRGVRSELEGIIERSLDDASGQVPGQLRDQYAKLKKDYHALRILQEAAEDSAARSAKGATLGLTDKIIGSSAGAVGTLMGGPVGGLIAGPGAALVSKVVRERGNAAAAAYLMRVADRRAVASLVGQVDARIAKSAAGVLRDAGTDSPRATQRARAHSRTSAAAQAHTPEKGRADMAAKRAQGAQIVKWVGDVRANPKRLMEQLEEAAELVGQSAGPKAAESYTASALRAISFIAAHVPAKDRRDPLDPRSVPPLTYEEADRLIRAATYATKPETVFDDFGRGKVTPEGLRAAQTFMPAAFAEFRMQLQGHVEDHMLHNRKLTQSQRLRIDKLLGYPAGADLRPEAIQRNQANYASGKPNGPPEGEASPISGGGSVDMSITHSGFDAVEARKAG